MIRLILLLAAMLPMGLSASDFCAVRLAVIDSGGKPADAPVALIDQDGHVEESVVAHGKVSLCDMKFGPHTIRVGSESCSGYVTIHGISLVYGFPRTFTVVSNGCINPEIMTLPPSCQVNFRITSPEGTKLAQVDMQREGDTGIYHADAYGRFFSAIPKGSSRSFAFVAPGYEKSELRITCSQLETIENVIRMVPK
jgi:hypothetical protein